MINKPYYTAYENRYQKVYEAKASRWGHSPDDEGLINALSSWVEKYQLKGKRIIEFACGEGASGFILSNLGCVYHGIDIAPSALKKAKELLKDYPNASLILRNMVHDRAEGEYDAALDVMGLHMLVTDQDRSSYLRNACSCLKSGAPMLFFRESYHDEAYEGKVAAFEEWLHITKDDYETPKKRYAQCDGKEIEVYLPLLPARAKNRSGYLKEMAEAGFIVDDFQILQTSQNIENGAAIYVHKPV